jgi:thiamine phosphate synthase YjbQ (UPF0047 family)
MSTNLIKKKTKGISKLVQSNSFKNGSLIVGVLASSASLLYTIYKYKKDSKEDKLNEIDHHDNHDNHLNHHYTTFEQTHDQRVH